jgi:hypothetical protein
MNISMIKIILEYLDSLYILLNKKKFILNDIEYNIVFYMLIEKLSINNNVLKEKIINSLNNYLNLCGPNKIISNIINISINKNNKVKTEILNIIINLYETQNLNIYTNNFISLLNNFLLSSNDKFVKDKCIFLFKEIYVVQGKKLFDNIKFDEILKKSIEEKANNDRNLKLKNHSKKTEIYRNRSYKENILTKKSYTISCNKNKNNANENEKDILFKTQDNFNLKINPQIQLEMNNNNNSNNDKKRCINKIRVKKIEKNKSLIEKMRKRNHNHNNKSISCNNNNSLNNSFNSNKENNCCIRGNSYDSNNHYRIINNDYDNDDIYYYKNDNILTKEQLVKKMNDLFSDNISIKINSIAILHDILCVKFDENINLILYNIEQIMDIFIKVIKEIFYYNNNYLNNNINIKFAKYILTTLCKLLSNKILIMNVSYRTIYSLSELIIQFLLLNEEYTEEDENNNQELTIIFKSLNSSMMRILDNYNITSILLILIELISNYYNKNINNYYLFISSIIKCLEKKTKTFDKIISDIEIDAILLQIHLLLNKLNKYLPELNPKNETDIMIINFIKNFIKEIISFKKEQILTDYNKSVKNHFILDKFIINLINFFCDFSH